LTRIGGLMLEVRGFEDLRAFKHASFDSVRGELNLKAPLLDFLRLSYHGIEVAD